MSIRFINSETKVIARPVSVFRKQNSLIKKKIRKEEKRRETILKLTMEHDQLSAKLRELETDTQHPGNYVVENKPGPVREGGYVPRY